MTKIFRYVKWWWIDTKLNLKRKRLRLEFEKEHLDKVNEWIAIVENAR